MLKKLELVVNPKITDIIKFVDGLVPKLKQFKKPLKRTTLLMHKSIIQNFAVGGRPHKWQANDSTTIARKGHGTVLIGKTGGLLNSIKAHAPTEKQARISSATGYGHFHQQYGNWEKRNSRGLIARPFMQIQKQDTKDITQFFITHVKSKFNFYQKGLLKKAG